MIEVALMVLIAFLIAFVELVCLAAYFILKAFWHLLKYVYKKLKQMRPPSLIRYDKDTNKLEVLR